jgi:hypothetical protein
MTEFEMAYLMTDMQGALMTSTTTLTTITSAFLVTGYVVGHRLSRSMACAAIVVFAWSFISTAFITSRQIVSLLGLVGQINEYAAAGKGLGWHAAARPIIGWAFDGGPYLFMLFCAVVFVGSILFFFHARRTNKKAEAGTWHPRI